MGFIRGMKKRLVILFFVSSLLVGVIFINFSHETEIPPGVIKEAQPEVNLIEETEVEVKPSMSLNTSKPRQADLVVIKVESVIQPRALFGGKAISFFAVSPDNWLGFLGIDAKASPGSSTLLVDLGEGEGFNEEVVVVKQSWPVTELALNEELEAQGYTPQNIATGIQENENVVVREAVSSYRSEPYFKEKFMDPVPGRVIVGTFGNIRESGGAGIQHLGTDLDAKKGDPVFSINDGRVVLVKEDFLNYGKTVVIDHGLGIFSLYLHLSEIKVTSRQNLKKGEVIGLVGNTGYSLEPHLHFSVKVQGASVDPLGFIDAVNASL